MESHAPTVRFDWDQGSVDGDVLGSPGDDFLGTGVAPRPAARAPVPAPQAVPLPTHAHSVSAWGWAPLVLTLTALLVAYLWATCPPHRMPRLAEEAEAELAHAALPKSIADVPDDEVLMCLTPELAQFELLRRLKEARAQGGAAVA